MGLDYITGLCMLNGLKGHLGKIVFCYVLLLVMTSYFTLCSGLKYIFSCLYELRLILI